jgi:RNA polymerase sigma-70 factor (ECF subfamily)
LFRDDRELIRRCLKGEVAAEKHLYDRFAPVMTGICVRYAGNKVEAKDILQNGFLRLYSHLDQFRFESSLEKWVQRIFVNAAVDYYHENRNFKLDLELLGDPVDESGNFDVLSALSLSELLAIIQNLKVDYRTVFNMYVIEGYQHKEIAEMLGIEEGTSKSLLHRAKSEIRRVLADWNNKK